MMMMMIGTNYYTAAGLFAVLGIMALGLASTYPAVKAYEKGKSFRKWYVFSFLFFPLALILTSSRRNRSSRGSVKIKPVSKDVWRGRKQPEQI